MSSFDRAGLRFGGDPVGDGSSHRRATDEETEKIAQVLEGLAKQVREHQPRPKEASFSVDNDFAMDPFLESVGRHAGVVGRTVNVEIQW